MSLWGKPQWEPFLYLIIQELSLILFKYSLSLRYWLMWLNRGIANILIPCLVHSSIKRKKMFFSNLLNLFFLFFFKVDFPNLLSIQVNYTEHSKNHSKVTLKYIFLLKKFNNFKILVMSFELKTLRDLKNHYINPSNFFFFLIYYMCLTKFYLNHISIKVRILFKIYK